MTDEQIYNQLKQTMQRSYSPYSKITVVSAIRYLDQGIEKVSFGVNVENASYGLSNCAERTAVFSAVTSGLDEITQVYIMSNLAEPIMPCGACRQVLAEFIKQPEQTKVICLNSQLDKQEFNFAQLLPSSFAM